jgi:hypothetical protein
MEPKFILPSYLNDKQIIRYIIRNENRFFDREENLDDILIFHFLKNSFSLQKILPMISMKCLPRIKNS